MIAKIDFSFLLLHASEKRVQFLIFFTVLVLQYLFEHIFPQKKYNNNLKNETANIAIGILNAALLLIPSALLVQLLNYTYVHQIGLLHLINLPIGINIILTIFIMDLAMYWWHRLNHTKNIFWRFHKFHHLDNRMNTTTALRFHTVELLFSWFFKGLFFILMGFSFLPIIIYEILFFTVVLIHHSNINISSHFDMQYRKLFSSPMMHRIHHSNKKQETDTNYGSVFSFWDRLFSTYKKEAAEEIIFGVDTEK
jgi:sterol desaturase/sphingolipid hydroxylase (fatty acid hydroxylase superfamily)